MAAALMTEVVLFCARGVGGMSAVKFRGGLGGGSVTVFNVELNSGACMMVGVGRGEMWVEGCGRREWRKRGGGAEQVV